MIKLNGIEIANTDTEFGLLHQDGAETWEFEGEEDARVCMSLMAVLGSNVTLIKRHIFVSRAEVAE